MGGVVLSLPFFSTFSSTNNLVGFSRQSCSYGVPWLLLAPSGRGFLLDFLDSNCAPPPSFYNLTQLTYFTVGLTSLLVWST